MEGEDRPDATVPQTQPCQGPPHAHHSSTILGTITGNLRGIESASPGTSAYEPTAEPANRSGVKKHTRPEDEPGAARACTPPPGSVCLFTITATGADLDARSGERTVSPRCRPAHAGPVQAALAVPSRHGRSAEDSTCSGITPEADVPSTAACLAARQGPGPHGGWPAPCRCACRPGPRPRSASRPTSTVRRPRQAAEQQHHQAGQRVVAARSSSGTRIQARRSFSSGTGIRPSSSQEPSSRCTAQASSGVARLEFAGDGLQQVVQGDQALHLAVFVDHEDQLRARRRGSAPAAPCPSASRARTPAAAARSVRSGAVPLQQRARAACAR